MRFVRNVESLYRKISIIVAVLALASLLDSFQSPADSYLVSGYVGAVHCYQKLSRPCLSHYCSCRFQPTCSNYSISAVEKYGLFKGMAMTIDRLSRCKEDTPFGTSDPVK